MTPTTLFALAQGLQVREGAERCYYCGASCGAHNQAADFVKSSFTSRDTICGGEWVCDGCVAAMDERASIVTPTGPREGQMVRGYSWILTRNQALACTKAHMDIIRLACLAPPEPPYSIVISDAGQKHFLYRGKVCWDRTPAVSLDGEVITYDPVDLLGRISLCMQIAAATGKPALMSDLGVMAFARLAKYYPYGVERLERWMEIRGQGLSRLAAWLCPNKEECQREYPATI